MADVAQLVRALVCGTRCREFKSLHPPHFLISQKCEIFLFSKIKILAQKLKRGFLDYVTFLICCYPFPGLCDAVYRVGYFHAAMPLFSRQYW